MAKVLVLLSLLLMISAVLTYNECHNDSDCINGQEYVKTCCFRYTISPNICRTCKLKMEFCDNDSECASKYCKHFNEVSWCSDQHDKEDDD